MYKKITLQHVVRIPPTKFGSNIKEAAFEILSEQFNGQIYENIGFIIAVID
ncbi:MAG: RPB7/RPC8 family DNA-directed RNA polymerase subunit, partial [Promethearchaeota archaeon]